MLIARSILAGVGVGVVVMVIAPVVFFVWVKWMVYLQEKFKL